MKEIRDRYGGWIIKINRRELETQVLLFELLILTGMMMVSLNILGFMKSAIINLIVVGIMYYRIWEYGN